MVGSIAYEFSRKFHMCDADDIRQELWVWFLEHPNKVKLWETLDGNQSIKLVARSLRNAAKDYCQREKARAVGYKVEDNYYYDREVVELLLPAVIRKDLVAPAMTELGFTKAKKVASEGGNWFAMMADIERGLARLTHEQLTIMYLRFGDACDNATLSKELDITEDAARMRVNRAMNNLLNYLGGRRPSRERDYTEEEANDRANDGRSEDDVRDTAEEVAGHDMD
jgi:DNA-directed RNA polymerase specialized sigma24 family protein